MDLFGRIDAKLRTFRDCSEGNIGITFSLLLLPAIVFMGAGVDYGRGAVARAELQAAVDSTSLMVAKAVAGGTKPADVAAPATTWFQAMVGPSQARLAEGSPEVNPATGEVCVTAVASLKTTIMKITHVDEMQISAKGCAQVASGTFEIALVLDTTGSMAGSASGTTKLGAMKTAAKQFVNYMMDSPALGPRTKIAVVPFSAAVRLDPDEYRTAAFMDLNGASPYNWRSPGFAADSTIATSRFGLFTRLKSIRSSWDWEGCVESLPYPQNVQDTTPSTDTPASLYIPLLAPDEPDAKYTYTYYDKRGRLREVTVSDPNEYSNDYIEDHSSACTSPQPDGATDSDELTKQSRLCKYKNGVANTSSYSRGPNALCTTEPLLRMQSSKLPMSAKIDALGASGSTNVHDGFIWGWRAISPNGPFQDGRPYNTENNSKIIVLMTDGENTWYQLNNTINRSRYSTLGYFSNANQNLPPTHQNVTSESGARAAMDELTRTACANARNAGVIIYTIGFSGTYDPIDDKGRDLLKDCAGDPKRAYFTNSSEGLQTVFTDIGSAIGQLRIAR